jgi:hypothetical protein
VADIDMKINYKDYTNDIIQKKSLKISYVTYSKFALYKITSVQSSKYDFIIFNEITPVLLKDIDNYINIAKKHTNSSGTIMVLCTTSFSDINCLTYFLNPVGFVTDIFDKVRDNGLVVIDNYRIMSYSYFFISYDVFLISCEKRFPDE